MGTVSLCISCHAGTSTAPFITTPGADVKISDPHYAGQCNTCHEVTDGNQDGRKRGSAASAVGGEDCVGCHTGDFAGHDRGTAGGLEHGFTSVTICEGCHTPYAAGAAISADIHDTAGVGADNCFTCHNSGTGALQGSATGKAMHYLQSGSDNLLSATSDGFFELT